MKRYLPSLILSLILVFSLVNSGLTLDSGQGNDTVYFSAGPPCSVDGDTIFVPEGGGFAEICINIWNDNPVAAVVVPLEETIYGLPNCAFMDPAYQNGATTPKAFVGSRVDDLNWGVMSVNLGLYPPQVEYGATAMIAPPMPAGDGLFAKMIYTVNDSCRVCLDTLVFNCCNVL